MNLNPTWLNPDGTFDHEHLDFIDLLHDCNTGDAYEPILLADDLYDIGIRYISDVDTRDKNDIFTALYSVGLDMELAAITAYNMMRWQAPGCAGRESRPAYPPRQSRLHR